MGEGLIHKEIVVHDGVETVCGLRVTHAEHHIAVNGVQHILYNAGFRIDLVDHAAVAILAGPERASAVGAGGQGRPIVLEFLRIRNGVLDVQGRYAGFHGVLVEATAGDLTCGGALGADDALNLQIQGGHCDGAGGEFGRIVLGCHRNGTSAVVHRRDQTGFADGCHGFVAAAPHDVLMSGPPGIHLIGHGHGGAQIHGHDALVDDGSAHNGRIERRDIGVLFFGGGFCA